MGLLRLPGSAATQHRSGAVGHSASLHSGLPRPNLPSHATPTPEKTYLEEVTWLWALRGARVNSWLTRPLRDENIA